MEGHNEDDLTGGTESAAPQKINAREIETKLTQRYFRGLTIQEDFYEDEYEELVKDYEEYMLLYESLAGLWGEHYANIQRNIDQALGLSGNNDFSLNSDLSPEEKEKLKMVGVMALFGCGFNATRELSPKVIRALKEGVIDVILVDFSAKALRSSTNFFMERGIMPKAAYQVDLTMGITGFIHRETVGLTKFVKDPDIEWIGPGNFTKIERFFNRIESEIDEVIEAYNKGGRGPKALFSHYVVREKDTIGLAVSTMVAAATFLTIYGELLHTVNQEAPKEMEPIIVERLKRMHAKFNAFALRFTTMKIAELCGENSEILVISDVNKVPLPGEMQEDFRAAVNAAVAQGGTVGPAENDGKETRMGRDGKKEEPLEKIIGALAEMKTRNVKKLSGGVPAQWMWWDEPGTEEGDYGHGHKVETFHFSLEKEKEGIIVEILKSLPTALVKKANPVMAARYAGQELRRRIDAEAAKGRHANAGCLEWLEKLNIAGLERDSDPDADKNNPYHFHHITSVCEIIRNVPAEIFVQGKEETLAYLCKNCGWVNDYLTGNHVKNGLEWLGKFIEELGRR